MGLRTDLAVKDDLDDPLPVPQLDEDEGPQIPSALNPPEKDYSRSISFLLKSPQITGLFRFPNRLVKTVLLLFDL